MLNLKPKRYSVHRLGTLCGVIAINHSRAACEAQAQRYALKDKSGIFAVVDSRPGIPDAFYGSFCVRAASAREMVEGDYPLRYANGKPSQDFGWLNPTFTDWRPARP